MSTRKTESKSRRNSNASTLLALMYPTYHPSQNKELKQKTCSRKA